MRCAILFCHYYFSYTKFMIFFIIIIEAEIYLEEDNRTAWVAVWHSLAVENWLASRTFTLDLEDFCLKNAPWVTFMPLTPLFCLQEKKIKIIRYSFYFFCSKIGINPLIIFFPNDIQKTFKMQWIRQHCHFNKNTKENWKIKGHWVLENWYKQ